MFACYMHPPVRGPEAAPTASNTGLLSQLPADLRRIKVAPRHHARGRATEESNTVPIRPAKPIAPYLGGKKNLARRICRIIDADDHKTYAEPFVGMGGVFLRRARPVRAEFINDANREIYNLFRILQEHYVAFLDLLKFQITTQANFYRLASVDPETLTDLQRAARFLYLQRCSFGGHVAKRSFGLSADRPGRFNLTTLEPDLEALHERLSGVTVMTLDFAPFISRIDRHSAFFYLDPPYWGCETDYGRDSFGRDRFGEMSEQLREIAGRFLLSINDVPEVRELFAWARIVPVETTYTIQSVGNTRKASELLIGNFDFSVTGRR